jgi:hypothetical protein
LGCEWGLGGEFEQFWPTLKVEMLKHRTLENEAQTRAVLQQH